MTRFVFSSSVNGTNRWSTSDSLMSWPVLLQISCSSSNSPVSRKRLCLDSSCANLNTFRRDKLNSICFEISPHQKENFGFSLSHESSLSYASINSEESQASLCLSTNHLAPVNSDS